MTKDEILKKVVPVIGRSLSRLDSEVIPTAKFTDDLGADSLDVVQMVTDIENEFDVRFTDSEMEKIITVQDAVDMIHKNLPA